MVTAVGVFDRLIVAEFMSARFRGQFALERELHCLAIDASSR